MQMHSSQQGSSSSSSGLGLGTSLAAALTHHTAICCFLSATHTIPHTPAQADITELLEALADARCLLLPSQMHLIEAFRNLVRGRSS
jgi:hypothetical protein